MDHLYYIAAFCLCWRCEGFFNSSFGKITAVTLIKYAIFDIHRNIYLNLKSTKLGNQHVKGIKIYCCYMYSKTFKIAMNIQQFR